MCGIAGILSNKEITVEVLQDMSSIMQHRGPDDEGFAVVEDNQIIACKGANTVEELSTYKPLAEKNRFNVGFVHRRLSIIELKKEGHQPMLDSSKNYIIVFNGEIYNYKELRKELEHEGAVFSSESDTEVVLQAFIKWGEECVHKFIGMWAFTIYNNNTQQLFISRDRFGIKPFYYFKNEEIFAFASEIKALFKIPGIKPIADKKLVSEYVMFGTISKPFQNLFKDIEELHPGHNGHYDFTTNTFSINKYYHLEDEVKKRKISKNFDNAKMEYKKLFSDSVHLHLRSDVPVGSCLSGGLDSSALVGIIAPNVETNFNTFTASYNNKQIDESDYAKEAIKDFNNVKAHFTYPNAKTFLKDISNIVYYHDQPVGSASMYAHWEVMKLAGQHN
jgi:asparagine synthase (glutamine-hydrolysing)